jgi:hypothetical protein
LLFLVHCNRPFVGPVHEFILALFRRANFQPASHELV